MRWLALIVSLSISYCLAMPASADAPALRDDHPERHVVVKGDTLWDISAQFLKSPWRWPELWHANEDHIKNPHLIYPGDVVYLTMTPEGPRLATLETVKLSPSVHVELLPRTDAIPPIPYAAVQALLHHATVADADVLAHAPVVIGSADGRGLSSTGDRVYAEGLGTDTVAWNVVRVGKPLKDPGSGEILAHEVQYVGDARVRAKGDPATLEISSAEREVQAGDYLVPDADVATLDFEPHAPAQTVAGQIISVIGSNQATGRYATVIINRGKDDGVEVGHVLAIYHPGKGLDYAEGEGRLASFNPKSGYLNSAKERRNNHPYQDFNGSDQRTPPAATTQLPDLRTGLIMVYRVFGRVAYALVMESTLPVAPLDRVTVP